MKILQLGQQPEVEINYEAIEVAPGEYIAWDHLDGFDGNYRSTVLDLFDTGIVHTEYILPEQVKNRYANLDLRFDATMMITNNHLQGFYSYVQPIPQKFSTNFVSCFNKTRSKPKQEILLLLYANGWFSSEHWSKCFKINLDEAKEFFGYINRPEPVDLAEFCDTIYQFELSGYGNVKGDLNILGPKIQDSFIHVVTETIGASPVPFPTEKVMLPLANKTLWLAYAPAGYHTMVEKHLGFKQYKLINYDFDAIQDSRMRLLKIEQELKKLFSLTQAEKGHLYSINQEVIEYNYNLIKSGEFLNILKNQDQTTNTVKAYRQQIMQSRRYWNFIDHSSIKK